MRTRGAVLLTLLAAALAVPAGGAPASGLVPGSDYQWSQPGTAAVSTPSAQPPASVPITPLALGAVPGSDYRWSQPGTAAVTTPSAQPQVWMPSG